MASDPPHIDTDGDRPTGWGGDAVPPGGVSSGASPTWAEDQLRQFVSPGSELPPDLLAEQKAVLLKNGDVVASRFEVVEQLGFGGMGSVYLVNDRELNERRALKVMLPSLLASETARERFLDEIRISQKLSHEGIVRVHDMGQDRERGFRFFTMEYIEGKTLHRLLNERGGKLPVEKALDITRQLCDALEYAHQYTIHRDLKPQNIMVRPDGRIKILDFGLAKLMSPGRLTRSSMALGTAYYQAPEQSVHLQELDQRADIYSIGVILYQMLTGRVPLGTIKPPSKVTRGIPATFDAITARCLEPQPEDRYRSAGELRSALDAASRRGRRRALLVGTAALILAVLGGAYFLAGRYSAEETGEAFAPKPPVGIGEVGTPIDETPEPEPPPSAPLETVSQSAAAQKASEARVAALSAHTAAQQAGAESYAGDAYTRATELLKDGEAHDRLKAFEDAVAKYHEAADLFAQAETKAKQVTNELAALEQAKAGMNKAKAEAGELDAATWAKTRYEQAVEQEELALAESDRVEAARLFREAKDLYVLALEETQQQGEAIAAAARKDAEAARTEAQSDDVKRYAARELSDADALMEEAGKAGADFEKAKELYNQAVEQYAEAVRVTPGRKEAERQRIAQTKAAMEDARKAAESARSKIGADEHKYAGEEVAAADAAWASASDAGTDYAAAEHLYKEAQTHYAKALKVTPGRKKAAQQPRAGEARTIDGIEFVWIPPGSFMMGSPPSEKNRGDDEGPQHKVTLSKGFWMGKYEVTKAQWKSVMGTEPWRGEKYVLDDANSPAVYVSWDDAQAFVRKAGEGFRLPTEAEWEYACRAGSTTAYSFGDSSSGLGAYAWYRGNAWDKGEKYAHEVGRKKPNAWGLYDMHGNVWEWCQDWHDSDYYKRSPSTDPQGPSSGSYRVLRGGSWYDIPRNCRSANRDWNAPTNRSDFRGFRVVCVPR